MEILGLVLDVLSIVGASSVVAASPVAKYLKHAPKAKKVLDLVAQNYGQAKNKQD